MTGRLLGRVGRDRAALRAYGVGGKPAAVIAARPALTPYAPCELSDTHRPPNQAEKPARVDRDVDQKTTKHRAIWQHTTAPSPPLG